MSDSPKFPTGLALLSTGSICTVLGHTSTGRPVVEIRPASNDAGLEPEVVLFDDHGRWPGTDTALLSRPPITTGQVDLFDVTVRMAMESGVDQHAATRFALSVFLHNMTQEGV